MNKIQATPSVSVLKEERECLGLDKSDQPTGIAISGGGIRSASFSIGVLQALDQCRFSELSNDNEESENQEQNNDKQDDTLFKHFDYLSTVSGGGYTGTSLSWFKHKFGEDFFPFGTKGRGAYSQNNQDKKQEGNPGEEEQAEKILTFIRLHGKYLTPTGWLDLISMIGTLLSGMLVSSSFYFLFLVLAVSALCLVAYWGIIPALDISGGLISTLNGWLELLANLLFTDEKYRVIPTLEANDEKIVSLGIFISIFSALAFLCITLITVLLTLGKTAKFAQSPMSYQGRTFVQAVNGILIKLVLLGILIVSLPFVYRLVHEGLEIIGPIGVFTGLLTAFMRFRSYMGKLPVMKKNPKAGSYLAILGAAIFIYTILLLSYDISTNHIFDNETFVEIGGWNLFYTLIAVFVIFGGLVNINYSAVGRMYRDRLMEAFLPDTDAVDSNKWELAGDAEKTPLDLFCLKNENGKKKAIRPYHLINSNVVLVNDKDVRSKGRGGASFLLSPLFIGSDATGYERTQNYMKDGHVLKYRGLTGATAMAISGAAANPNTGVGGEGITRNPLISFLMTFFNIRLGYWGQNPAVRFLKRPNLLYPGIPSLLGFGYKSSSKFLDLSDGGHFENLGLYELLRRRCKLIIASDAGADPDFNFTDLGTAVERTRVDFGVKIRFSNGDYDLEHIIPGTAGDSVFQKKFSLAKRGFAIGKILYPASESMSEQRGILIYIKSTLTANLPTDLYGYKTKNPSYPDQTTADQFFDEAQFEAYRELGYEITKSALDDRVVKGELAGVL